MGTFHLPCWTGGTVGVGLDVVLTLHVSDAVEAVGVQSLEVPGTVDGHWSWLHVDGGWIVILEVVDHWTAVLRLSVSSSSDLGSEMTRVTSSAGTMYQGLRLLTLFTMVLKEVSFLDPSWMVLKEAFLCTLWGSMALLLLDLGSLLTHLVDGLERTLLPDLLFPWRLPVFEWSWKEADDSDLLLCLLHGVLPSIHIGWSWKEFLVLFSVIFSIAKTDFEMFLHKTRIRSNLMLAGWPTMICFSVLISTT